MVLRTTPFLISLLIKTLGRTIKFRTLGAEAIEQRWKEGLPSIIAFWHQRLLMLPLAYRGRGLFVLISTHQDGELISRAISHFGFSSVRGSVTRSAASSFKRLVEVIRSGADVAITPDGPRGPKWRAQSGVVALAKITGVPIFPITYACSRQRHLSSWDSFVLPGPFGRGVFLWGEPIIVPPDANRQALELHRKELESRLIKITEEAERLVQ